MQHIMYLCLLILLLVLSSAKYSSTASPTYVVVMLSLCRCSAVSAVMCAVATHVDEHNKLLAILMPLQADRCMLQHGWQYVL